MTRPGHALLLRETSVFLFVILHLDRSIGIARLISDNPTLAFVSAGGRLIFPVPHNDIEPRRMERDPGSGRRGISCQLVSMTLFRDCKSHLILVTQTTIGISIIL